MSSNPFGDQVVLVRRIRLPLIDCRLRKPSTEPRTGAAITKNSHFFLAFGEGLTAEIADPRWTSLKTAVHQGPMKLIDAPIRAARWGGRAA